MANTKNPTALFMQRMREAIANASKQGKTGSMAFLLQQYFHANFGATTLPKQVADFVIYNSQIAVGNKTIQFFQGAYDANNSNMPQGSFSLPESEHAVVLGFRFLEGTNATVAATDWKFGVSDAIAKNGTLTVQSNGTTYLTKMPLTEFNPNTLGATVAGVTSDDQGMFWLMEPIIWLGQTDLSCNVNFVSAPATANYNLRLEVVGIRFIGS